MCGLSSDVNNTLKTNTPRLKTRAEIDVGNSIEYDVKSCQVKRSIVKFTRVQLKELKLNRPQK